MNFRANTRNASPKFGTIPPSSLAKATNAAQLLSALLWLFCQARNLPPTVYKLTTTAYITGWAHSSSTTGGVNIRAWHLRHDSWFLLSQYFTQFAPKMCPHESRTARSMASAWRPYFWWQMEHLWFAGSGPRSARRCVVGSRWNEL